MNARVSPGTTVYICPKCGDRVTVSEDVRKQAVQAAYKKNRTRAFVVLAAVLVIGGYVGYQVATNGPPRYEAKVVDQVRTRQGIYLSVDVTNTGLSAGTPQCSVSFIADDGSVLETRPFNAGTVYPNDDNVARLTVTGFNVALVSTITATCA